MNLNGNTVLITGGGSGIGLALATRFLENGSKVIVCGRNLEKLESIKSKFPKLHIKRSDVANEDERLTLFNSVIEEFPEINIVINNAGIQQRINLKDADWNACRQEIAINFEAPIHLSVLFIPNLLNKENAYIINVTSGLAFMPPAWVPVYGATKAGMHSFTFSLREQLFNTNIGVIEVIPPAVDTDLGGVGIHTFGVKVDDFANCVFEGFSNGLVEIAYKDNLDAGSKSRVELEASASEIYKRRSQL